MEEIPQFLLLCRLVLLLVITVQLTIVVTFLAVDSTSFNSHPDHGARHENPSTRNSFVVLG
jgi:hypothetical protein